MNKQKGFTLVELLVVIAIVAILLTALLLTLNPAELLKQTRDVNRISDLVTLKKAISVYLAVASGSVLGDPTKCYISVPIGTVGPSGLCGGLFSATITASSSATLANYRKVDGNGWIPVNFSSISSGAPLGNLPVDPVNNATYYYAYVSSSTLVFELDASAMESVKYKFGGSGDVVSTDGGNATTTYEVGTASGFAL